MLTMATGGGKTVVAAGATQDLIHKARVLYLANRNELVTQPLAVFRNQLGFTPGLEKAESRAPLDSTVVVASIQTMSRKARLDRFPRDHFGYIWCDEAHMAAADSWTRVLDHFEGAKVVGITATPFRSDAKDLTSIFQTEAYRKDLFSLVDEGYLVSPDHVDKLTAPISLEQVRVKRNASGEIDYDLQDAATAIEPWFEAIALEIAQKHAQRRILAFLPLVASSQKFVAACVRAGLRAIHIDGEDPLRDQKLESFRRGEIQLLSNSNLLHTGIDIPRIDCTLNLRPTRSKVLYVQIVGRSTRTLPGVIDGIETVHGRLTAIANSAKPKSFILDPLWLSKDHNLVTPAFLIAANQEVAEDMNKAAGPSYSLRALHSRVQQQREEAIRRRLQATARFREGLAWDFFAASVGDHEVINYEPVYKWELQPPTKFSKLLLKQAGINPETVTSEGLAREIMRSVGRRRYQGLAELPALAPYAELAGINEQLWLIKKKDLR
jgi:superfamily II DNA or RNA helicase